MVKLATTDPKSKNKLTVNAGTMATKSAKALKDFRFDLAHSLHSSLELETILQGFINGAKEFVELESLQYLYDKKSIDINIGRKRHHHIEYRLASSDCQLGTIAFSRSKRFSETEMLMLEMLIGILFHPLKNALLYQEAINASMMDSLTGIGNRAAMDQNFERELKLSKRHGQPLAVLIIDIDHFKSINDNIGHRQGDKTLQQVAQIIQNTLRDTDQVFRYGGEEFVSLLSNTTETEAKIIAERIRVNIAMTPIDLDEKKISSSVSVGVSVSTGKETESTLFEKADKALYQAKNMGRNRVEMWTDDIEVDAVDADQKYA